jgi:hypothetical protein
MKTGIPGTDTPTNKELLLTAYAAYNRQDSEALLALPRFQKARLTMCIASETG